ncbi:MAG: hypothetical protein ACPGVT_10550 [Maricaulaceae bacterium]
MKYTASLLALTFVLTACGSPESDSAPPLSAKAPVDLRVTAELETGIMAKAITVMPNDAAQWVSQVVMIDENGDLYQSGLDDRKARHVKGKATHIAGIMRRGAAGLVLSLTPSGGFGAYIESDDEGTLAPLPISAPDIKPKGFCVSASAPEDSIYVRTEDGAQAMLIDVTEDNSAVSLSLGGDPLEACPNISTLFAYEGDSYALPPRLVDGRGVSITEGITIAGASALSGIYVTTDNLGATYSKGAVLAADANAKRLVIISLEFANRTLAAPSP